MADNNNTLNNVRDDIKRNVNKNISITEFNKQGRMIHEYNGTIEDCYDNLFLVKVCNHNYSINKSFSYSSFTIKEMIYTIAE